MLMNDLRRGLIRIPDRDIFIALADLRRSKSTLDEIVAEMDERMKLEGKEVEMASANRCELGQGFHILLWFKYA